MDYPQRKHPRLKTYDYSLPGYYYVTIHGAKGTPVLSRVGRGLAPAGTVVSLTEAGAVVEQQILALERRYPQVTVDKYVIMPDHLHLIVCLSEAAGASPRPTLMDVIGTLKSLSTRICNETFQTPGRKLFQTSFYDTVLRNERAYQEAWNYIDANPVRWLEKTNIKK